MIADGTLERFFSRQVVRLTGPLIRGLAWTGAILLALLFVGVYARLFVQMLQQPEKSDFTIFYYTARMLQDGHSLYGPIPPEYGVRWESTHLWNLNPPHVLGLFVPLARLPYAAAAAIWVSLGWLSVVASLVLALRELGLVWTPTRVLVAFVAIVTSVAFASVAVTAEMSLLLVLPFTLAWRAARRGQWLRAGSWLGVCAGAKPFLLLFVPCLAVARRVSAAAAMTAIMLAVYGAGFLMYGWETYADWVRTIRGVYWWEHAFNASSMAFFTRLLTPTRDFVHAAHLPGAVPLFWTLASAIVGGLTILNFTRGLGRSVDEALASGILCAVLVSPLGWVYYLPLALGPLVGIFVHRQRAGTAFHRSAGLGLAGLALLYVPVEVANLGSGGVWQTATVGSVYFWGVLAIWASLLTTVTSTEPA